MHWVRRPLGDDAAAIAWSILIGAALVVISYFRARHTVDAQALFGFEPTGLIHPVWDMPQFSRDYANGEAELLKSLSGQIFRLSGFLSLPDPLVVGLLVFLEAAVLAAGVIVCARAVEPGMDAWRLYGTALFLIAGTLFSSDFGRWFHPFYGASYNYANGAGLAALGMMLRKRPVNAGGLLGLAGLFHPIIAFMYGIGLAVAGLSALREVGWLRMLAGAALAIVIAGSWEAVMLDPSSVAGSHVDPKLFIGLTRLLSSHWFPVTLGVFGERAWETLLPYLGVMLVFTAVSRFDPGLDGKAERTMAIVVLLLTAVAFAGALVSEYSGIPLLVKLAFQRASAAALLLAGTVLVPRLLRLIASGRMVVAALAAAILLSAFWRDHGPPVVWCIAFGALAIWQDRTVTSREAIAARLGLLVLVCGWCAALLASGSLSPDFIPGLSGLTLLREPWFVLAVAVAMAARLFHVPALLTVSAAIGFAIWIPSVDRMWNPADVAEAQSFREVQDWAREHTALDSLFMLDPTHAYGWRQYSLRPSFGTVREWLYSGWIYDTRAETVDEGIRRAGLVGIDVRKALSGQEGSAQARYGAMLEQASRRYNRGDPAFLAQLSRSEGIDYFVFDKHTLDSTAMPTPAFSNDRYAVYSFRSPDS